MPLSKRTDFGDAKYAGAEVDDSASRDVPGALTAVVEAGFDFMVAPLALEPTRQRSRRRKKKRSKQQENDDEVDGTPAAPFAPSDLLLPSQAWSSQVVGKISTWIDCDADGSEEEEGEKGEEEEAREMSSDCGGDNDNSSSAERKRELALDSEAALAQELAWAAHLSLQAVVLQPPPPSTSTTTNNNNTHRRRRRRIRPALGPSGCRAVCSGLRVLGAPAIWLRLPLWWREGEGDDGDDENEDPWHSWDELRSVCEHNTRLGVILDLPAKIAPAPPPPSSSAPSPKRHPAVEALRRWVGEPLKAVSLPAAAFAPNGRGFPALGRVHQELLGVAFAAGVQVVMSGVPGIVPPPDSSGRGGGRGIEAAAAAARAAREYLAHVFRRPGPPALPGGDPLDGFDDDEDDENEGDEPEEGDLFDGAGGGELQRQRRQQQQQQRRLARKQQRFRDDLASYRDFLQAPLQPLQDDLESSTYETFERDSPKYEAYREAVRCFLSDRLAAAGSPARGATTVLMVVGAGRGPLVRASLAAADAVGASVRIYAVEKNPNAVITLQGLLATDRSWEGRVTVVAKDMRRWKAPEPADAVVSELLGSFGDNELSPECLDGAQRFLKRGGVSIPESYTSFLEPVTAAKPWSDARGSSHGSGGSGGGGSGDPPATAAVQALETPYVVHLHRFTRCCRGGDAPSASEQGEEEEDAVVAGTQPVFTFEHPRRGGTARFWKEKGGGASENGVDEEESDDDDEDANARRVHLRFQRRGQPSALIHGLAGYFETTLYSSKTDPNKTVKLSTHPPTHTRGMASWFPIFFPLVSPLRAPANKDVEVSMWRRKKGARVWYEWFVRCEGGDTTHLHNPGGRSYFVGL